MKFKLIELYIISMIGLSIGSYTTYAASANPTVLKAKQEAEARGYIFATSQEEIVLNAKKEGKLRVMGSLDQQTLKALNEAFRKKYPFIDSQAQEIAGTDNYVRMIQEMKAGMARSWDVNYVAFDMYPEYLPFQKSSTFWGWRSMECSESRKR